GGAGKLHFGTLGTVRREGTSLQLRPRSSLANRRAGSVPANKQTCPFTRFDAREKPLVSVSPLPLGSQVLPLSALTCTDLLKATANVTPLSGSLMIALICRSVSARC